MPNGIDLRRRFKLKVKSWYRYPDEKKWNIRVEVYDSEHHVDPGEDPISDFDFDFDGDMDDARNRINVKLWEIMDEETDQVLEGIQNIVKEYGRQTFNKG